MIGNGIENKQSQSQVNTIEVQERGAYQVRREVSKLDNKELSPIQYFARVASKDLEQNKRLSMQLTSGRSYKVGRDGDDKVTRVRFIVCTLGLVALAMSQMSRMVLNLSITQMVEQDSTPHTMNADKVSMDGSCPWPDEEEDVAKIVEVCTSNDSLDVESTTLLTVSDVADITESPKDFEEDGAVDMTDTSESSLNEVTTTEAYETTDESGKESDAKDIITETTEPSRSLSMPDQESLNENTIGEDAFISKPDNEDPLLGSDIDQQQSVEQPDALANATHIATTPVYAYPRYRWTVKQQNVLLGAFYSSYFVFMILGGRLAEAYGAKYVLMLSVAGSAVINLATPWMADTSFILLVASRVVMGAIQAGVFPGMYALFSKWLTMTEASIFAPLIKMNLRLGMTLGSLIPGIISGWPNVFYLTGFLSVVWSLLWWAISTSDPADNSWVSAGELARINRKKQIHRADQTENGTQSIEMRAEKDMKNGTNTNGTVERNDDKKTVKSKTPWIEIITAPSVIALIIVKYTFNFGIDFLAIELPSYLKYVHHASKEKISVITTNMFLMQVFLIVFVGWLAKIAVQRKPLGLNKTGVRKVFQGLASFGLSLTYFLLTFNNCNIMYVIVLLITMSFLSMFTSGGETMLPYDLSEEYPATIMAIANSVANTSAVTITTLTAVVLGDQAGSFDRWNKLIYIIAGMNLIGGLSFTFLVKAEPIKFSKNQTKVDTDLEASKA